MTYIVHCKTGDPYDIYIGRPSIFGNPYSHKEGTLAKYKVDTIEEAVEKYKEYVLANPELLKKILALKGKVLSCWCAKKGEHLTTDDKPYKCHGQVILEIIEKNEEE